MASAEMLRSAIIQLMEKACEVRVRGAGGKRLAAAEEAVNREAASQDADGTVTDKTVIRFSALGDLMQCGEWRQVVARGELAEALGDLASEIRQDDVVFANLETTTLADEGRIPKEPLVLAPPEELAQCLRLLGVDVVNLANNHAFDAYLSGFHAVRRMLDDEGIAGLGAGESVEDAAKPLVLQRRGIRLGFLAYADASSRPSHVATDAAYGVHDFDLDHAVAQVEALKPRVDHVVVSLHWGIEYCHIPSPLQVQQARRLVDAGARLVVGHHVHVVQGVERHGDGVIAYNLGNVTTSDHHVGGRLAIHQTPRTRSSFVLRAAFSKERLEDVELVPIRSQTGRVLVDDPVARRYLASANRKLAAGITESQWRRTRFYEDLVVRTARKLHPKVIRSVRPKHVLTFARNIVGAVTGRGPSS